MFFDEEENYTIVEETPQTLEKNTEEVATAEESSQAKNFRALREKMERIQRERDEAINYIKNIESSKQQANTAPVEDDMNIDPDALVEGKHLAAYNKKLKQLEEQQRAYYQQSQESVTEAKLKAKYSDFDKIVSKDNVEALRHSHPEIWSTINSNPDLYNKAVAAYTLIKELRIAPDESYNPDKMAIQKNIAKPRPLSSMSPQQGDTPLSRANAFSNGLTDELKDQLRKEMEEARRNR